ncbi:hypothetical protein ACS0TY_019471 [Phlomoides rotata]
MDFTNDLLEELRLLKTIGFDMNGRFVAIHNPVNLHVLRLNDLYGHFPDEKIVDLLDFANAIFEEVPYLKMIEYVDDRFIVTKVSNTSVVEIAPVVEDALAAQLQESLNAFALSVAEIKAFLMTTKHYLGAGSRISSALFSCELEVIMALNLEDGSSVPLSDLTNRSLALFKVRYSKHVMKLLMISGHSIL